MEDQSDDAMRNDNWWRARGFVDVFNKRRVDTLNMSIVMVLDESISYMVPM